MAACAAAVTNWGGSCCWVVCRCGGNVCVSGLGGVKSVCLSSVWSRRQGRKMRSLRSVYVHPLIDSTQDTPSPISLNPSHATHPVGKPLPQVHHPLRGQRGGQCPKLDPHGGRVRSTAEAAGNDGLRLRRGWWWWPCCLCGAVGFDGWTSCR